MQRNEILDSYFKIWENLFAVSSIIYTHVLTWRCEQASEQPKQTESIDGLSERASKQAGERLYSAIRVA